MTSYRFRFVFAKCEPIQYTSHLDLMRIWERSLRRAGVDLAYSGGFNPRPKLQLAAALPLGHTGEAELIDVWLGKHASVEEMARALVPVLPSGLAVREVRQVGLKEPALQTQVVSADYRVIIEADPELAAEHCHKPAKATHLGLIEESGQLADTVSARIDRILAAPELVQERRKRQYDLRPLIERLSLESAGAREIILEMQLAAQAGATGRPEGVLEALGLDGAFARYHRRRLLLRANPHKAG
jgi:radical SAM-linked protein